MKYQYRGFLRYFELTPNSFFSRDRRSSSRPPLRHPRGDVHRVQNAQKGRGIVRPGRAEEIARSALISRGHEARRPPPQPRVLRLNSPPLNHRFAILFTIQAGTFRIYYYLGRSNIIASCHCYLFD